MFVAGLSGSEAGLIISCAMSLIAELQWGIRQSTETENQMTSVERIMEYCKIQPEASLHVESHFQLGKVSQKYTFSKHDVGYLLYFLHIFSVEKWPQNGNIKFEGVYIRYKNTDQPALKNVSCFIKSKEKVLMHHMINLYYIWC